METIKKVLLIIIFILAFILLFCGCRGLIPLSPPGDYAFFWRQCDPLEGIAVIEDKYYPYTDKVSYKLLGNRFFTKKDIYLGNGYDYSHIVLQQLKSQVSSCDPPQPITISVVVTKK